MYLEHEIMQLCCVVIPILLSIYILFLLVEGNLNLYPEGNQATRLSSPSSAWLKNVTNSRWPRPLGCWRKPWICKRGAKTLRARMRCCRNRCVDVSSDVDNCGLCGFRCLFTWQCCKGFCVNTNICPFNCGRCGNRCNWGVRCVYGMCGYGQTPRPPRPWPRPPIPFPPRPRQCPPRPPGSWPLHQHQPEDVDN